METKTCSWCKASYPLSSFRSRVIMGQICEGETIPLRNTCVSCRLYDFNSRQEGHANKITCHKCNCQVTKRQMTQHLKSYTCNVFGMDEKPSFNDWLKLQPVESLAKNYKQALTN